MTFLNRIDQKLGRPKPYRKQKQESQSTNTTETTKLFLVQDVFPNEQSYGHWIH